MPDSNGETTTLEFFIGFLVSVFASIMYAAGLNLLKADHVANEKLPKENQRVDCSRPKWHLGLYLYVVSQAVGSTVALNYLKTQWVAPLGSISLIFNFIFAKLLVGTEITNKDVIGTFIVLISVCWIVFSGGQSNSHEGIYCKWILLNEKRKERSGCFKNIGTPNLKKLTGIDIAIVAGLFASQTLLLAKSGVKLAYVSIKTQVNQFTDLIGWFVLIFLIITAILQIVCLNEAVKLCDSVLVMPIFLGLYTTMGLINTMIYLDEFSSYPVWALVSVFVGIIGLTYGVVLLSHIKDDVSTSDIEDEDLNSIHKDDDDKSFSGLSSTWSSDTLFDKKKNAKNKRWSGGRRGKFEKLELNDDYEEKNSSSIFVGFKGFKGFKGFYHNGSVKSDGYNSEYNSYYSSENNSNFSIGDNSDNNSDIDLNINNPIMVKEWSGDLGSIINLDKLITESAIGKRIIAENMEKEGGLAV
ncbi:1862_t:CDS:2 [Rhizophagus irregularis]|nr:1862_t:CDS:2 [Rhizophagus irregularis]